MKRVFILIPAFNEGDSIGKIIGDIIKTMRSKREKLEKIIIIDDGSTDNTKHEALKFSKVAVYSHKVNLGLGAAVRSGLNICKELNADIVVKIDADGQHDPKDITNILFALKEGKSDIVYGRRRLKFKTTLTRRLGNVFFSKLMKYLTGWDIKDSQPGIFGINKDCLERIKIFGDYNYTQQVLLSAQLGGMRFSHEDVSFSKRQSGRSFVDLSYIYKALSQILVLLIFFHPLKIFGRFGLFLLTIGSVLVFYQGISWLIGYSDRVIENVNLILGLSIIGGQSLLAGLLGQLITNQNVLDKRIDIQEIKKRDIR